MVNGMDMCGSFGITASSHAVDTQVQGAGVVRLTLTKSGDPKTINDAYLQGQAVQGDPYVLDLKFKLKQSISVGQAVQVTLSGMTGATAQAKALSASQQEGGLIVTSLDDGSPKCGDGECNGEENCESCPDDCGECGGGWCNLSGSNGEEIECEINLAAEDASSPKATQFQVDFGFTDSKVSFEGTKCMVNGMDMCGSFGITASSHAVDTQVQGAGVVRLTLTKSGDPKTINDAYVQGQAVQGDPYVLDLKFKLKQSISAEQAVQVTLSGMTGATALAKALTANQQADGLIVTSLAQ